MKKELKYNILTTIILLLLATSAALCQQKRISEFVDLPHADSTFTKAMPVGTIVLDTTTKELYRLTAFTASGTSLTSATKVLISGDYDNGIYSGSDTVPSATIAYLTDNITFNGATNVAGQLKATGAGTTSATYSLIANDNSLNTNFFVRNDGAVSSRLGYWLQTDKIIHKSGGSNNLFSGISSGQSAIGASDYNSFYGDLSGSNIQGDNNSGMGFQALQFVTSGTNNSALGYAAGAKMQSSSSNNVVVGYLAGGTVLSIKTGNVFLGSGAGGNLDLSEYNTFLGCNTSVSPYAADYSHSVAIGAYAVISGDNQFVTGDKSSPLINYYFGRGVAQTSTNLGSDGVTFNSTSITAGESNKTSSFTTIHKASAGTGSGDGGSWVVQIAPAGASGTSQNSFQDALRLEADTTPRVISYFNHTFKGGIDFNDTDIWVYKEIDIGDWDMQTDKMDTVAHTITNWKTIRDIAVIIRNDADDTYSQLSAGVLDNSNNGVLEFNSTNIILERVGDGGSGRYMNENYNDTSYNRGYISFWYKL